VKPPKESDSVTLPFEDKEVKRLLYACDLLGTSGTERRGPAEIEEERQTARALILLMIYSGLRISDATTLTRDRLDRETGRLMLRTMKTKHPVTLILHRDAVRALSVLPVRNEYFFFWVGGSNTLASSVARSRALLQKVAKLGKVYNGHPHRYRDTFAKALLVAGKSIRTVQLLLGHTSIKTTEKSYAAFVPAYQESLDDATAALDFTPETHAPVLH
jgi:integrase